MKRYLEDYLRRDLPRKMVLLTSPRQVGKTFLARQLAESFAHAVYLNYDVPADAAVLHANIARSIQKMPRLYFFDSGYVNGDEGIRLENTVAVCLRKYADFEMDVNGHDADLRYLRTKDHRDVDFALVRD